MKINILKINNKMELTFYTDVRWNREQIIQEAQKHLKNQPSDDDITILLNPETLLEAKMFESNEEFLWKGGKLYEKQPSLFNLY